MSLPGGSFQRRIAFLGEGGSIHGVVQGEGMGGRLTQDLSRLTAESLITRNDHFYIRTRKPRLLEGEDDWRVSVGGLVRREMSLTIPELTRLPQTGRDYLVECSGNGRGRSFGLMSVAKFEGVSLLELVERAGPLSQATHVRVSGFDEHTELQRGSIPGASWVFSMDQLRSAGAFLATHMNGVPLPADHGAPVRLAMPGWYGCTWIKWVNEVTLVDASEEPTGQMTEFAGRTHQPSVPDRASAFIPATIDQSAMPIRVEQWEVEGEPVYRVFGIMWGGDRSIDDLVFGFNDEKATVPRQNYIHDNNAMWSLWEYQWRPTEPGRYDLRMEVPNPAIRTRRLDSGWYRRAVQIEET